MDDKDKILNLLKKNTLTVISTINSSGQPNSAVIGFAETDDFEIIFGTYNDSRKYSNLKTNHNTSFAIGWDGPITVQYEGVAEELTEENSQKYKSIFIKKNPQSAKYEFNPKQRYFLVKPTWLRYTELNQDPWNIIELDFTKQ